MDGEKKREDDDRLARQRDSDRQQRDSDRRMEEELGRRPRIEIAVDSHALLRMLHDILHSALLDDAVNFECSGQGEAKRRVQKCGAQMCGMLPRGADTMLPYMINLSRQAEGAGGQKKSRGRTQAAGRRCEDGEEARRREQEGTGMGLLAFQGLRPRFRGRMQAEAEKQRKMELKAAKEALVCKNVLP